MHSLSRPDFPENCDRALQSMFAARKRVFVDLLKWDVPVLNDAYEVDQFDTRDALYLVLTDPKAGHRASTRLLRTDRAHILSDLFRCLCDGPVPSGEHVREITRFCIEPALPRTERLLARNELVTALAHHALANGITHYTAVANMMWYRQIAAFGWKCDLLGPSQTLSGGKLVALQIAIEEDTLQNLAATGIYRRSAFQLAETGVAK